MGFRLIKMYLGFGFTILICLAKLKNRDLLILVASPTLMEGLGVSNSLGIGHLFAFSFSSFFSLLASFASLFSYFHFHFFSFLFK